MLLVKLFFCQASADSRVISLFCKLDVCLCRVCSKSNCFSIQISVPT